MLAFGATACLAKSTEARDVLHAIHLASRGLHVLPAGCDARAHDARRPGAAHPARGRRAGAAPGRPLERRDRPGAARRAETVRTHARHIYRKLGVETRRELRSPI